MNYDVLMLAVRAHDGQLRRGTNDPYVLHPIRVAARAKQFELSEAAQAAALLHDVVEDTDLTIGQLRSSGYVDEHTLHLVGLLTKWWGAKAPPADVARFKEAYYAAILKDPEAAALKLLDRLDNVEEVTNLVLPVASSRDVEWAVRYYGKTTAEFTDVIERWKTVAWPNGGLIAAELMNAKNALNERLQHAVRG